MKILTNSLVLSPWIWLQCMSMACRGVQAAYQRGLSLPHFRHW